MPPDATLREFTPEDTLPTHALFRQAILIGAARAYDLEQRNAWAGPALNPDRAAQWQSKLGEAQTFVMETSTRMLGFMTTDHTGYLDMAFVAPDMQGQGVAQQLYDAVEDWAKKTNLERLTTHASHLARPLFTNNGWRVLQKQTVEIRGVALTNFRMEKRLGL